MHLLIPFASAEASGCREATDRLALPALEKILQRLALVATDAGADSSLTPPHERALARARGVVAGDGCIPWAAMEVTQSGRDPGTDAWAWITPVHWDVGADHILMADPQSLDLHEADSRALLAAMQPYFSEDGITLEYTSAERWRARARVFDGLASASLDRVAGREITAWMPTEPSLRRLQSEMQMLLYTHPVNDARLARGLASVNSFWVSGTGQLRSAAGSPGSDAGMPAQPDPRAARDVVLDDTLRKAALRNDWTAWAQAWMQLDQNKLSSLLNRMDTHPDTQLSLCGERSVLRFASTPGGMLQKLRRRFTHTRLQDLRDQL